jgi:hypothetical protein
MGEKGNGEEKSRIAGALGMSRRDLLRRGAILGGTLAWVTPVIQSVTRPAYANTPSARDTSCCSCKKKPSRDGTLCNEDMTLEECQAYCGAANVESYMAGGECDPKGDCVPSAAA